MLIKIFANSYFQVAEWHIFPQLYYTEISESEACEAEFCSTLEGNKRKIESYDFTKAEPYFQYLTPRQYRGSIWEKSIELPVIVTGSSSNHYREAVTLIQNLKEVVFPVYKTEFIFFDLGLMMAQRKKVLSLDHCSYEPHSDETSLWIKVCNKK